MEAVSSCGQADPDRYLSSGIWNPSQEGVAEIFPGVSNDLRVRNVGSRSSKFMVSARRECENHSDKVSPQHRNHLTPVASHKFSTWRLRTPWTPAAGVENLRILRKGRPASTRPRFSWNHPETFAIDLSTDSIWKVWSNIVRFETILSHKILVLMPLDTPSSDFSVLRPPILLSLLCSLCRHAPLGNFPEACGSDIYEMSSTLGDV